MKKASKLLLVLLTVLMAAALVVGCTDGTGDPTNNSGNEDKVIVGGTWAKDWKITNGYQNDVAESKLKVESATLGTDKVAQVTWSSSMDFRGCELFAPLPEDEDYGQYDGITFKVMLPASANFLLILRNPNGGTTWKIWEDYVYRGRDDDKLVWVTVNKPFADAEEMDWGAPPCEKDTLKEWLTADKAVQKQLNLNPVLNVGGGGKVNTDQVTLFKEIGFYKGSADSPTSTHIVWKFEEITEPAAPAGWVRVYTDIPATTTDLVFHLGGEAPGGSVQIQKIFLNNTETSLGAKVIFDFTKDPGFKNDDFWWEPEEFVSHVQNLGTANGRYEFGSDDGYSYGGGFAPKAIGDYAYIGFLIKDENTGDARFEIAKAGDPWEKLGEVKFSDIK